MPTTALLVVEDGRSFLGQSFGAQGEVIGEVVVTSLMSGYQEILTTPALDGKILVTAAPHIGNTGWNDEDNASDHIHVAGVVARDPSPRPSSWRAERSLDDEMKTQGVVGVCGIDTRALIRHVRDRGPLRACISTRTLDAGLLVEALRVSPRQPEPPIESTGDANA